MHVGIREAECLVDDIVKIMQRKVLLHKDVS